METTRTYTYVKWRAILLQEPVISVCLFLGQNIAVVQDSLGLDQEPILIGDIFKNRSKQGSKNEMNTFREFSVLVRSIYA